MMGKATGRPAAHAAGNIGWVAHARLSAQSQASG